MDKPENGSPETPEAPITQPPDTPSAEEPAEAPGHEQLTIPVDIDDDQPGFDEPEPEPEVSEIPGPEPEIAQEPQPAPEVAHVPEPAPEAADEPEGVEAPEAGSTEEPVAVAVEPGAAEPDVEPLPPLPEEPEEPEKPYRRPRLIPLWAIIVPLVVFLVGAGIIVFLLVREQTTLVTVPNVTNLDVSVARSRLAQQGLRLERGDQRFSPTVPVDGVVDQIPQPGERVPRGSAVTVILSAGSESFPMPDVVGLPLQNARESLQAKGLVVQTEVVASSRPKNTIVSSTPAAGVTLTSSSTVKLMVSSGSGLSGGIQPVDMTGKVFVIDPEPVSADATDTPMEVQRRLNSLLEASGAKVVVTRSITETGSGGVTPGTRGERAREASATAVIGLDLRSSRGGGMRLTVLDSQKVTPATYLGSAQLSQSLLKNLTPLKSEMRSVETSSDPVLEVVNAPGVRVSLGSTGDRGDLARFADPEWEDGVAAAIYTALAEMFGAK